MYVLYIFTKFFSLQDTDLRRLKIVFSIFLEISFIMVRNFLKKS